eukprot:g5110.t1
MKGTIFFFVLNCIALVYCNDPISDQRAVLRKIAESLLDSADIMPAGMIADDKKDDAQLLADQIQGTALRCHHSEDEEKEACKESLKSLFEKLEECSVLSKEEKYCLQYTAVLKLHSRCRDNDEDCLEKCNKDPQCEYREYSNNSEEKWTQMHDKLENLVNAKGTTNKKKLDLLKDIFQAERTGTEIYVLKDQAPKLLLLSPNDNVVAPKMPAGGDYVWPVEKPGHVYRVSEDIARGPKGFKNVGAA